MSGFEVRPGENGVFYLRGELDIVGADVLGSVVMSRTTDRANVVLDMSEVSFVDSTGIRAIIVISRQVDSLTLRASRADVARVLGIAGIDRLPGIRLDNGPPAAG